LKSWSAARVGGFTGAPRSTPAPVRKSPLDLPCHPRMSPVFTHADDEHPGS
jgi:hypothetical protein